MKSGKDMTREEKLKFLSGQKLPVDPNTMTDNELSGAVNMILIFNMVQGK